MKTSNAYMTSLLALAIGASTTGCREDATLGVQLDLKNPQTGASVLRMETRNQVVKCLFDPRGILQQETGDENSMGTYVSGHGQEVKEGKKVGILFTERGDSVRLVEGVPLPAETIARFENWTKEYEISANEITTGDRARWIGNCKNGWNREFKVVSAI